MIDNGLYIDYSDEIYSIVNFLVNKYQENIQITEDKELSKATTLAYHETSRLIKALYDNSMSDPEDILNDMLINCYGKSSTLCQERNIELMQIRASVINSALSKLHEMRRLTEGLAVY